MVLSIKQLIKMIGYFSTSIFQIKNDIATLRYTMSICKLYQSEKTTANKESICFKK